MGLPRLNSCCWKLDLKTGNIVLGCINAFSSFTMFVIMIVASVSVSSVEEAVEDDKESVIDPETEAMYTGMYAMSVILVFMYLAKFIFDMVFVYGVVAERSGIIKAYYIMWLVFFLLSSFTFFVNVSSYSTHAVVAEVLYLSLNIYAVLLCHSYYKQLNDKEIV